MIYQKPYRWPDPFSEALTWHCLRADKLAGLLGLTDDVALGLASRLVSLSELPPESQRAIGRHLIQTLDDMLETSEVAGTAKKTKKVASIQ